MRRPARLLALAALALSMPTAALAAPAASSTRSVTLHVTKRLHAMQSFAHVMASAKLLYKGADVTITLTADNLPKASTLGKRVYVLFAADGAMTDRVGALRITGSMAGVTGQVMMSKVADLYVYAESSPMVKHPQGIQVLSAMVG